MEEKEKGREEGKTFSTSPSAHETTESHIGFTESFSQQQRLWNFHQKILKSGRELFSLSPEQIKIWYCLSCGHQTCRLEFSLFSLRFSVITGQLRYFLFSRRQSKGDQPCIVVMHSCRLGYPGSTPFCQGNACSGQPGRESALPRPGLLAAVALAWNTIGMDQPIAHPCPGLGLLRRWWKNGSSLKFFYSSSYCQGRWVSTAGVAMSASGGCVLATASTGQWGLGAELLALWSCLDSSLCSTYGPPDFLEIL